MIRKTYRETLIAAFRAHQAGIPNTRDLYLRMAAHKCMEERRANAFNVNWRVDTDFQTVADIITGRPILRGYQAPSFVESVRALINN